MKITNNLQNPTVTFDKLVPGDVFMTLAGDILIKSFQTYNESLIFENNKKSVNSLNITTNRMSCIEHNHEVVPIEAEIILKKNSYEKYAKP